MAALVDEATLRIVFSHLGPTADEVVVDSRSAAGTTIGGAPCHELKHIRNGEQLVQHDGVAHRLVPVFGAAAHGLGFGCGGVVAASSEHQDLLYQARARTTARTGFGVLAHLVQSKQALLLNGFANGAFGHPVAAAHFISVGHGRGFVMPLMSGVANIGLPKHKLVANIGHRSAVAQQLEIPTPVHRVAVQAGTHQPVVLNHELFVNPRAGVAHHNLFAVGVFGATAGAAQKVSSRKQINAGYFQLRGGERSGVAPNTKLRQMVGSHLGLFK